MSQSTTTRERSEPRGNSRREDRLRRNQQLLQDPHAQFFRTRTPEGRMLIGMLIALDRGLHVLRLRAGHQFTLDDVMTQILKVRTFVSDLQGLITDLQGGAPSLVERPNPEDPQTMGFLPRTDETRQLGLCVSQLDASLMRIRMTSQDLQQESKVFERAVALIKRCHDVTGLVAQSAGTRYELPRSFKELNGHLNNGGTQ